MTDDRTVVLSDYYPLTVRVEKGASKERESQFTRTFRIGRGSDCDVQLLDRSVSKHHVEIRFEGREWWAQDLKSHNGTFLNGTRIEQGPLLQETRLELGNGGPVLVLTVHSLRDQPPSQDAVKDFETDVRPTAEPLNDLERRLRQAEKAAQEAEQRRLGLEPSPPKPILPPTPSIESSENRSFPTSEISSPPPLPEEMSSGPSSPNLKTSQPVQTEPHESLTEVIRRSLKISSLEEAGERTIIMGKAVRKILKHHSQKYQVIIGIIAGLSILLGGVAWYQYERVKHLKGMASELFYAMKERELELGQLEDLVLEQLTPPQMEAFLRRQDKLRALQQAAHQEYERFLEDIGIYSKGMSDQDRLILRMTRLFGENEVEMPEGFVEEVKDYIRRWQSTDTLEKTIRLAVRHGYGLKVTEAMLAEHMPPQFFYIGVKESGFDQRAVGPRTRFGIAKGPWQFIPSTAVEYGLRTGPLVEVERYDPRDERHDFHKATRAASKYLSFLYNTEAQASGLLVMASYNWGPTRVDTFIRQLPENPKDRNFWQLLKQFKVPKQTRDYVFYIFSAAVIGENPKLFGFDFDNPLKQPGASSPGPSLSRPNRL